MLSRWGGPVRCSWLRRSTGAAASRSLSPATCPESTYGFVGHAQRIAEASFDAAGHFGHRLPELFCGFSRTDYPVRCRTRPPARRRHGPRPPRYSCCTPCCGSPRTPRRPDLVRASDPGALPAAVPEESAARELTSGFDIQDDRWELTGLAAREPNLSRPHGVRLAGTDSSLLSRPSHIPDRTSGDAIADAGQDRPSSSAMTSRGPPERGRLAAACRPLAGR